MLTDTSFVVCSKLLTAVDGVDVYSSTKKVPGGDVPNRMRADPF
jgi:hypothetical protein